MAVSNGVKTQSSTLNDSLSHVDRVLKRTTAQLGSTTQWVANKSSTALDRAVTPEQRQQLTKRTNNFIETNPKLAAFIATNLVLTGIPILLFLTFSISVLAFSVSTGLIIGLISALVFTATSVGVALCFLFPTVFFTTIAAVLLFAWGLIGFTLLQWASQMQRNSRANHAAVHRKRPAEIEHSGNDQRSKQDTIRFSEPKQNAMAFDFSAVNDTSTTPVTGGATASSNDHKLVDNAAPVKYEKIEVPKPVTSGMAAS